VATTLIPIERIANAILVFRGQRLLLDSTLATMYSVKTKGLNQAVRRNRKRFPTDFMFQLSASEAASLRSQTVTSSSHGGRRFRPYVFTEQGVRCSLLFYRSERAIAVNIEIMRALVRLRGIAKSHTDLARKLDELEKKYDRRFKSVFEAIRHLMNPPARSTRRRIGFRAPPMNARSVERR
jgi:ORF6N domain.